MPSFFAIFRRKFVFPNLLCSVLLWYTKQYTYNIYGQLIQETDSSLDKKKVYEYNENGCMVSVKNVTEIYSSSGVLQVKYSYDAFGNCTISGTVEFLSATAGIQFGDAVSIQVKGYAGFGFTLDFSNGLKFGLGLGVGYEISITIDWYELFH